jgi:hypothetical protein
MKFYKYSNVDTLKLSPILYNGEFINSIPFIAFYDNSATIFRCKLNSKWGEILTTFQRIDMRQENKVHKYPNYVKKCLICVEVNRENFFLILPIKVHSMLKKINILDDTKTNFLHINNRDHIIVSHHHATNASISESNEFNNINQIEESKYDIDDWFGTYKNNEKMLDFFKNNYKELYIKYIENERESKLNYLFEK